MAAMWKTKWSAKIKEIQNKIRNDAKIKDKMLLDPFLVHRAMSSPKLFKAFGDCDTASDAFDKATKREDQVKAAESFETALKGISDHGTAMLKEMTADYKKHKDDGFAAHLNGLSRVLTDFLDDIGDALKAAKAAIPAPPRPGAPAPAGPAAPGRPSAPAPAKPGAAAPAAAGHKPLPPIPGQQARQNKPLPPIPGKKP